MFSLSFSAIRFTELQKISSMKGFNQMVHLKRTQRLKNSSRQLVTGASFEQRL